jgi:hypothetical protein
MVKAAVVLLTKYTTADKIRRAGKTRITTWLLNQGCYNAETIASRALEAAQAQRTTVQAQEIGADIVASLARTVLHLHDEVSKIDKQIEGRFREHRHAGILLSMPGFGPLLAAELLAATGGDMTVFDNADRLAGVAGLAPVPRDSGRISGDHHRPKRYDRRLLRTFYLAAQSAARYCPESRTWRLAQPRKANLEGGSFVAPGDRRVLGLSSTGRKAVNVICRGWPAGLRAARTRPGAPNPGRSR